MKNFQKTLSIFVFALLLTGVFTLGGCEKTDDVVELSPSSETLQLETKVSQIDPTIVTEIKWLVKNGFIPSEEYNQRLQVAIDKNQSASDLMPDGYFVAPDYVYTRTMVQDMMKSSLNDKQARHRRNTYMSNGGSITVRALISLPAVWKTAVTDAISEWNALGYNIAFVGVSSANDNLIAGQIDIAYGTSTQLNIPTNLATAVFASTIPVAFAGGIGEVVGINQTMDVSTSKASTASARKMIIAHELGHALGLKHTETTEGIDVSPVILCNGISGYTDFGSIMRSSFTSTQAWSGFTTCDKVVIDYYW